MRGGALEVRLEALDGRRVGAAPPDDRADESPALIERPLFWIITAGVLVVSAGVTLAFLLTDEDGLYDGDLGHVSGVLVVPPMRQ